MPRKEIKNLCKVYYFTLLSDLLYNNKLKYPKTFIQTIVFIARLFV